MANTELKSIESLHEFKRKIKEWKGKNCPADYAKYNQKLRMNIDVPCCDGYFFIKKNYIDICYLF